MRFLTLSAGALVFSSLPALAQEACDQSKPCNVPEISALEGTAAIAVVVTIVLLAWERRRRAV